MSEHPVENNESKTRKRKAAYRASIATALILAVLTIIEFFAAIATTSAIIMMLLGVIKAYFVVNNFMHVSRLWSTDGGH